MCGVKLTDRNKASELMTMLGLTASMKMLAKANAPRWFERVLTADDNPVRMALNFKVSGKRKGAKEHVEGKSEKCLQKARLKEEDAFKIIPASRPPSLTSSHPNKNWNNNESSSYFYFVD